MDVLPLSVLTNLHRKSGLRLIGLAMLGACVWPAYGELLVPLGTVITFDTVCANCHEGECSRRLSFTSGHEAAIGHIQRYAGPQTDESIKGLFDLLKYMKENCAYYPLPAAIPQDRIWQSKALEAWFSAVGTSYFIPLGMLAPGRYAAVMEFDREAQARLQVVDEQFNFLTETTEIAHGGMLTVEFSGLAQGECYLRVYPAALTKLKRLSVRMLSSPDEGGAGTRVPH